MRRVRGVVALSGKGGGGPAGHWVGVGECVGGGRVAMSTHRWEERTAYRVV